MTQLLICCWCRCFGEGGGLWGSSLGGSYSSAPERQESRLITGHLGYQDLGQFPWGSLVGSCHGMVDFGIGPWRLGHRGLPSTCLVFCNKCPVAGWYYNFGFYSEAIVLNSLAHIGAKCYYNKKLVIFSLNCQGQSISSDGGYIPEGNPMKWRWSLLCWPFYKRREFLGLVTRALNFNQGIPLGNYGPWDWVFLGIPIEIP